MLHENDIEQSGNYDSHVVEWVSEPITMQIVREDCGDCPNCMLSVLRQSGLNHHYFKGFEFDYKVELAEWMKERQQEDECRY